ncbi:MAG: AmmeMemoRadiSam system radical SAM enzyme [Desulfobacterales bacterium]|nr:AmmeMemoRadiSam system radical SAM enzyme [Desulfobacterales bacterium]MCF8079606.1 AmmeMemoRadiSam system radical SAM enzyme [Desulfobacterales bacterium]
MEAALWEALEDGGVRCRLCNHRCRIKEGRRGICGVRENVAGRLHTLVYGRLVARNVDPIEKKPLFHVLPGSQSYSIATVGCNFRCRFCQNADIAQLPADRDGRIMGRPVQPEAVVEDAGRHECATIAYTYTEPTVFFEFAFDTAALALEKGIRNVFVTNGYMTPEAIESLGQVLAAANVDLKAFSDKFYKEMCAARLAPVLDTLRLMKKAGIFVEVTTLIIPGANDDPAELRELAEFLREDLGPETPWHISRFHPTYKLTDRPPTPVQTLRRARDIGLSAGLRYVYTGNVPGEEAESTYCHQCGERLIERWGFTVRKNRLRDGKCPACGAVIDGIWV